MNIAPGNVQRLVVRNGQTLAEAAAEFAATHSLTEQQLQELLSMQVQQAQQTLHYLLSMQVQQQLKQLGHVPQEW